MRAITTEDPGTPDTRGPLWFLVWIGLQQWPTQVLGLLTGVIWMVAIALVPAAVGRGIDEGIVPGDWGGLVRWALALVGLGILAAAAGAARHWVAVHNWLQASYRSARLTARGIEHAGPALTRSIPAGEVIAVFANDVMRIGGLFDVAGRFMGAVVSYVVVGAILLAASPALGWLVLLGGPVLLACLSFIVRPLQRRQAEQREQAGLLTTLGADTVAGLRVLRGIGGEQTFLRRYEEQSQRVRSVGVRVAGIQAALDSSQVLLPGVFVVLVTWIGARFALDGQISAGQLVAFYGYAAFLTMPLRTATEFTDRLIRAHIGARRVLRILAVEPDQEPGTRGQAPLPDPAGELHDRRSGVRIRSGGLTALVSARPEETAAIADRLGRFGPGPHDVTWSGLPLDELALAEVRERIVVSEADPRLFTGTLRGELLAGRGTGATRTRTGLRLGLGRRALRGPRRCQRPRRARGRARRPRRPGRGARTVLLGRTAPAARPGPGPARATPRCSCWSSPPARSTPTPRPASPSGWRRHRRGRTTVVTSASPLLLGEADEVVLVEDGRVTATGTHHDLLAGHPAYRDVVTRGGED